MKHLAVHTLILIAASTVGGVTAHGGMTRPVARNVIGKFFKQQYPGVPTNYDWNALSAGGPAAVFAPGNVDNHGPCGDAAALAQPRPNEHGGKYGTGVVTARYEPGAVIPVQIKVTAHHEGFFQFDLCADPGNAPATEACFARHAALAVVGPQGPGAHGNGPHVATDDPAGPFGWGTGPGFARDIRGRAVGGGRYWRIPPKAAAATGAADGAAPSRTYVYDLAVRLPADVASSDRAVLRWYWQAGNYGVGAKAVEEFWNCADVAIGAGGRHFNHELPDGTPTAAPATAAPATPPPATPPPATEAPATEAPATEAPATTGGSCVSIDARANDAWCQKDCAGMVAAFPAFCKFEAAVETPPPTPAVTVATPPPTPTPTPATDAPTLVPATPPPSATTGSGAGGDGAGGPTCVTHAELVAINAKSGFWPSCDAAANAKPGVAPPALMGRRPEHYGQYCTPAWAAALNDMFAHLGLCGGDAAARRVRRLFLAQVQWETGYMSTLFQPLDGGSGVIHMIPANWLPNVRDMELEYPGEGILAHYEALGNDRAAQAQFFMDPRFAYKSAAAWMRRTNRVIPTCGKDLFAQPYDEMTRCIFGRVTPGDRAEPLQLVTAVLGDDGGATPPPPATAAPATAAPATAAPATAPPTAPPQTEPPTTAPPSGGDCVSIDARASDAWCQTDCASMVAAFPAWCAFDEDGPGPDVETPPPTPKPCPPSMINPTVCACGVVSETDGDGCDRTRCKADCPPPTTTPEPTPATMPPATAAPTTRPPAPVTPPPTGASVGADALLSRVLAHLSQPRVAAAFDETVLLYEKVGATGVQWARSTVYTHADLLAGLRVAAGRDGIGGKRLRLDGGAEGGAGGVRGGGGAERLATYGLVNVAAFLAQAMQETIRYNACDENSWDLVDGKAPIANACGQLGQSYQDYTCAADEAHMACEVDPTLELRAATHAGWYGAPQPLYCAPRSQTGGATGWWDHSKTCHNPWKSPPEYCTDYVGQKAGGETGGAAQGGPGLANRGGRDDVEGCCYWGRGVIQTTGVCNFGKLNYFLGKRAHDEGRTAAYPDVDFCKRPDLICAGGAPELKWIAGFFYWMESVQRYDAGGWDYFTELRKFVDGGMRDAEKDAGFIHGVSGIVNRGCHNPPCKTGALHEGGRRAEYFATVLEAMGLREGGGAARPLAPPTTPATPTTMPPTMMPTTTAQPKPVPRPPAAGVGGGGGGGGGGTCASINPRASDAWCAKDCATMVAAYPTWCAFDDASSSTIPSPMPSTSPSRALKEKEEREDRGAKKNSADAGVATGTFVGIGAGVAALAGLAALAMQRRRRRQRLDRRGSLASLGVEDTADDTADGGLKYCVF